VLLDIDPTVGLRRFDEAPDRMESESLEFHRRVRDGFLEIARRRPERYLVIDALLPVDEVAARIRGRVGSLLPQAPAVEAIPVSATVREH
jgi:dTMP kinase